MQDLSIYHKPVMVEEVLESLSPESGRYYLDATAGAGGHSEAILTASSPNGRLLVMDVDPQAISITRQRLAPFQDRAIIRQNSYLHFSEEIKGINWNRLDGILFDLGTSSMQIDTASRGFSFQQDGDLDMRFDPTKGESAQEILNSLPAKEISRILIEFGEVSHSHRLAEAICLNRPIQSTIALCEIIRKACPKEWNYTPLYAKVFQALRIYVNSELDAIKTVIPLAIDALNPGGRLAVISFHSLEDRIVKQIFAQESRDCVCPPEVMICRCNHTASVRLIHKRGLTPSENEMRENPRSRSARLRVVEKLN